MYDLIEHQTDKAGKAALLLMVELYRRRVWTDNKTVNAIAAGCLSKNAKMVLASCKFMLDLEVGTQELEDDESDREEKKNEVMRVRLISKRP